VLRYFLRAFWFSYAARSALFAAVRFPVAFAPHAQRSLRMLQSSQPLFSDDRHWGDFECREHAFAAYLQCPQRSSPALPFYWPCERCMLDSTFYAALKALPFP